MKRLSLPQRLFVWLETSPAAFPLFAFAFAPALLAATMIGFF